MALIKCKECGQEVSDHAKACPHCGAKIAATPLADSLMWGAKVFSIMFTICFLLALAFILYFVFFR